MTEKRRHFMTSYLSLVIPSLPGNQYGKSALASPEATD
jgi:hypothetical protein